MTPEQMVQVLTVCIPLNLVCAGLQWFRGNYRFTMAACGLAFLNMVVVLGLKYYYVGG